MQSIKSSTPSSIKNDLDNLSAALDNEIPLKENDNFFIATWNIRSLWHHNLISLREFNIDRNGSDLWKAFTSTNKKIIVSHLIQAENITALKYGVIV